MSLLTIQRSPSNSNSISSSSDSGGVRESEENQRICKSLNECYFAGKGTALMLGSNERLQRQTFSDGRRLSQISVELSASQTSIGSVGSDIQQHLQSMFYLLRPEETLKMAVKLESLRAGRTRYLVVVSRPASKKAQISSPTNTIVGRKCASPPINNSNNQLSSLMSDVVTSHTDANESENNDNNRCSSSILTTSYQNQSNNSSCSVLSQDSANMTIANADTSCDIDPQKNSNCNHNYNNNFTQCSNIQDDIIQQCDNESTIGSSCSSKSSSNEIEESCLLGIDCNEKTTVGLVLKVLADTAIRLDGDGGFSVSVCGRQHIFKPVSVQAMCPRSTSKCLFFNQTSRTIDSTLSEIVLRISNQKKE